MNEKIIDTASTIASTASTHAWAEKPSVSLAKAFAGGPKTTGSQTKQIDNGASTVRSGLPTIVTGPETVPSSLQTIDLTEDAIVTEANAIVTGANAIVKIGYPDKPLMSRQLTGLNGNRLWRRGN